MKNRKNSCNILINIDFSFISMSNNIKIKILSIINAYTHFVSCFDIFLTHNTCIIFLYIMLSWFLFYQISWTWLINKFNVIFVNQFWHTFIWWAGSILCFSIIFQNCFAMTVSIIFSIILSKIINFQKHELI